MYRPSYLGTATNMKYMPQLDSLRAFAMLGVLPVHFLSRDEFWLGAFVDTGSLGVKMFFVLSGFLIGGILINANKSCQEDIISYKSVLRKFYVRRAIRLFPLYYLYILICFFMIPTMPENVFWFLSYTQNILFYRDPAVFASTQAHLWTLAIEEQFYLIAPVLILSIPNKYGVYLFIASIILSIVIKIIFLRHGETDFERLLISQSDLLSFGVLIAYSKEFHPSKMVQLIDSVHVKFSIIVLAGAYFVSVVYKGDSIFTKVFGNLLLGGIFGWIILKASYGFKGANKLILENSVLVYLGKISYGIYLLHFNVPGLMRELILPKIGMSAPDSPIYTFILYTAVSVAIASLSWYLYERPILSLKKRYKI